MPAQSNAKTTPKPFSIMMATLCRLLTYNPAKRESVSIVGDGATRVGGSYTVTILTTYTGDTLELFIAFMSADGIELYCIGK